MLKILFGHKSPRKTTQLSEFPPQRPALPKAETDNIDIAVDYSNITYVKQLSDSKFPVHLISSTTNHKNYAVKVFSHTTEDSQRNFRNEIRFAFLKHPNIINMIKYERDREITNAGEIKRVAYILMEYAPHGDLFDFIVNHKPQITDKLIRTYFRQLIEGIEFLHRNGIAHLDLKPENVLIGADSNLKICDFDLSWKQGDAQVLSQGTKYYRAPEFFDSRSSPAVSFEADIYSAGVILFLLKSGGVYPHGEGDNLADLMYHNNSKFWKQHCEIQGVGSSFYDSDFKELFNKMTKHSPKERLTISKIKKSKWYNGPVYSPVEFNNVMSRIFQS